MPSKQTQELIGLWSDNFSDTISTPYEEAVFKKSLESLVSVVTEITGTNSPFLDASSIADILELITIAKRYSGGTGYLAALVVSIVNELTARDLKLVERNDLLYKGFTETDIASLNLPEFKGGEEVFYAVFDYYEFKSIKNNNRSEFVAPIVEVATEDVETVKLNSYLRPVLLLKCVFSDLLRLHHRECTSYSSICDIDSSVFDKFVDRKYRLYSDYFVPSNSKYFIEPNMSWAYFENFHIRSNFDRLVNSLERENEKFVIKVDVKYNTSEVSSIVTEPEMQPLSLAEIDLFQMDISESASAVGPDRSAFAKRLRTSF